MREEFPQTSRRVFVGAVGATAVSLAGCAGTGPPLSDTETATESETAPGSEATIDSEQETTVGDDAIGYTHQRATGNRVVGGRGPLPDGDFVDVGVSWTPAWVVGIPETADGGSGSNEGEGTIWAIVGENGEVVGVRIENGTATMADVTPDDLALGLPPVLRGGRPPALVTPPVDDAARLTPPVPVETKSGGGEGESGLLYISENGDLVLWNDVNGDGDGDSDGNGEGDGEIDRLAFDALPDARIVTAEGRAFVFADATSRYDHAVLGDGVEAGSVTVVDYRNGLSEVAQIQPNPDGTAVFEGIAPIVADLTGDGERNVVVTESDRDRGARVVAFEQDGQRVATGPTLGYGWRHQLAVAPFGPDGHPELAAVRTPHVGKTAEFYRLEDDELRIVGEVSGYSSHAMGSRNLDAGLAGDLDGDGQIELLVPTANRQALGAVRRTKGGAKGVWEVSLDGTLTTNVGAVNSGEQVTVGAGWDGTVRFWQG